VLQAISILSTLKNTADFKWNTFLCQHRVVDSGSHQVQGLLKAVPFPTGDSETELPTPDVASVCPHNPHIHLLTDLNGLDGEPFFHSFCPGSRKTIDEASRGSSDFYLYTRKRLRTPTSGSSDGETTRTAAAKDGIRTAHSSIMMIEPVTHVSVRRRKHHHTTLLTSKSASPGFK